MSVLRSDSGNQICSHAGRMPEQDKVQRVKITSVGSKLVVFIAAIIKGILRIIMNKKKPLRRQGPGSPRKYKNQNNLKRKT